MATLFTNGPDVYLHSTHRFMSSRSKLLNRLVDVGHAPLSAIFAALADGSRRRILIDVSGAPMSVSQLAAPFSTSLQAVSKHVTALETAGLIKREGKGRLVMCTSAGREELEDARDWIALLLELRQAKR